MPVAETYSNTISSETTLNASISSGDLSLVVVSAAQLPASPQFRLRIDDEVLLVTGVAGTTLTITRGAEGTSAAAHAAGATVHHVLTRDGLKGIGGSINLSDTFANRPAAGTVGRIFVPSNGLWLSRDNGASWDGYGPLLPITEPSDTGFAWVNQDSATLTTTSGGRYLFSPATSPDGLHMRVKTLPSAPYTLTMGFVPMQPFVDFLDCGMVLRDSGTSKIVSFSYLSNSSVLSTAPSISVFKWTDEDTFSALYTTTPATIKAYDWSLGPCLWFQISDDATTRKMRISNDGINFHQVHSVANTDFMSPNQFGYYSRASNASFDSGIMVVSLKVS